MGKNFIGVFISHGDTDEGHYPLSSLNAFRNVVNQLDRDTNGMIRIAFDYDGYEDHSKNNSTQNSILDTLDKLREQYEYLLFFRLMDPEYGRGMRIEYDEVQKLNRGVEPNKQIAVRTLVKKYDETDSNFDKAENTWDEITNKSNQESDVSKRYKNDEELTLKAGYMINKFYHLKKREKSFWKWLMAAIVVGILLWHFSGPIHELLFDNQSRDTTELPIGDAKTGEPKVAPDSLSMVPKRKEQKASTSSSKKDKALCLPTTTIIEDRTFEIYGVQNPFRAGIVSAIQMEMPSLEKPSENKKEQWSITIEINPEFTEVPKIIDSDEYMIDIEYSFSIKDNLAGKTVFENTFSTRGRSPASLEDAKKHSRQIAAKEIAQQIKQFIQ